MFKKKEPKYNIGDKVQFVNCDFVRIGRIWRIHTHWFRKPSYEIFSEIWDLKVGNNYKVSESDIMELI